MEHNPYYDESLGQSHIDPNAALHNAQLNWLQQQESDRLRNLNQQAHGGYAGLNSVSQQYAPQHHPHNGPGWGGVAAGALIGAYVANRQQQAPQQFQARPVGWKGNVWGWYALLAAVLHFVLWMFWFANAFVDNPFGPTFWLIGTAVWIPAWTLAYLHQSRVSQHNAKLQN